MSRDRTLDFDKITAAAIRTAKWATTMTRWRIGFETRGKRLLKPGVNPARRWQLVGFPGPAGRESAGIVDLIAIRKDHSKHDGQFKRGDLFEIILIQIKGGGARWPNADDIRRLRAVVEALQSQRCGFGRMGQRISSKILYPTQNPFGFQKRLE